MQVQDANVVWHDHVIDRAARENRNGHQALVLWFTGLSGSGKSTLAGAVEQRLFARGARTYLLDGDNVRHGLCSDLGFSDQARQENIRRVGEVARLMVDGGLLVLTAFISPHLTERAAVRQRLGPGRFWEIFVDTPLAVCEQRDPKGLYRQARAGELKNFTGIDGIYEAPVNPEIHLDGCQPIDRLAESVVARLVEHGIISGKLKD